MAKIRLQDFVVLLPGITGSVLRRGDIEIWADSFSGYWNALSTKGASLRSLVLHEDNLENPDAIEAVRLISGSQIIPGLIKIDGYGALSRLIQDNFQVMSHAGQSSNACNYLEFPYDWRRDIRWIGRQLASTINNHLYAWRQYSGAADARTILIAHSMGGLIAKYYLECLAGWRDCRALITFGTPFRGSLNALNYLAHGYRNIFFDLTEVLRSCTSVYQLLPTYKMIDTSHGYCDIQELEGIPGFDRARAIAALKMHAEIKGCCKDNETNEEYHTNAYGQVSIVGTSQTTLQSARLKNGTLEITANCPQWLDSLLGDGDGTVPRYSAVDSDKVSSSIFVPERHSALQNNVFVLNELRERLRQLQSRGTAPIRGITQPTDTILQGVRLDVNDFYVQGEPISIAASPTVPATVGATVTWQVEAVNGITPITTGEMQRVTNDRWELTLNELPKGTYRINIGTAGFGETVSTVSDIFEIL